jgi:hypothetical protein
MGALPLDLALSAVLTARLDGAGRPALLAAVAAVPSPRPAPDDVTPLPAQAQPAGRGS